MPRVFKVWLKGVLQVLLGVDRYLIVFSLVKSRVLRFDRGERDFLHFVSLLPVEGTILDIGANIGITAALLARKRPRARVLAFEPIAINVKALRAVIRISRLNNIECYPVALGADDKQVEMIVPRERGVLSTALSHMVGTEAEDMLAEEGWTEEVELRSLDGVTGSVDAGHIVGIKIDTENSEYGVITGGRSTIREYRPLMYVELWRGHPNRERCLAFMRGEDYVPMTLRNGRLHSIRDREGSQNVFFVPEERVIESPRGVCVIR